MKQQTVGKWIILQPVIVVFAVSGPHSHGNVTVQDGEHKRNCKNDRTGISDQLIHIKQITDKKIRPGKDQ